MAETKQEVKHTALPWHQGGTNPEEMMSPNTIFAADGAAVAQFYGISLHNTLKEVDKKRCAEGLGNIATVLEAVNSHTLLVEALEAIAVALKDPAGGEYWTARKFLDKQGVWHGDIDGEKVLLEVAKAA